MNYISEHAINDIGGYAYKTVSKNNEGSGRKKKRENESVGTIVPVMLYCKFEDILRLLGVRAVS